MTLDLKKTGGTTRRKAEDAARKISETNGFPDWSLMALEKLAGYPNICLIIGRVK